MRILGCRPAPSLFPASSEDQIRGVDLSNASRHSLRFTAPILFALGTLNAWTAQKREDHGALVTALCLCVCAAGLFAEDRLQASIGVTERSLRTLPGNPGAATRHIARAVGARERVAARTLSRLTGDCLLLYGRREPALRSYRLTS